MRVDPLHALDIDHVSFRYGQHAVLDAVSAAVPAGQYVGIIGPNGGGKTTLLKLVLGLLSPSSGSLAVFGKPPIEARKHGLIGYVPQRAVHSDLSFPVTVRELVMSARASMVRSYRQDRLHADQAMHTAGVSALSGRLMSDLSGGERQRVFIARALASEPKLLLLDEPTTGVDAAGKEQFYSLLTRLNTERGLTILFVSHDIEAMTKEVGFVLALNQKLLCHCSSHAFLSEETLRRLYGRDVHPLHHHDH